MAGETDIEVHKRRVEYHNTLRLALQQDDTLLWAFTETHDVAAELGKAFDEMPAFSPPDVIVGKLQAMPIKQLTFTRRWLSTIKYHDEKQWDTFDITKTLTNPASSVIKNFVSQYNRAKDLIVINAMFGAVRRGMDGPGDDPDTVFDATNQVVAINYVPTGTPANSGLTLPKIIAAKAKFMKAQAGTRDLHVAISSKEWADLMNDATFTDAMYRLGGADESGTIRMLGLTWHIYEDLPLDGSGYRRCVMWARDGIRTGVVKEMTSDLRQRADMIALPWQAHWWADIGAARADEKLLVEIKTLAT